MKSQHVHLWGCKGRPPRAGDLCMCCPCEWSLRAGNWYRATDYKPRTKPHQITRVGEAA